MIVMGSIGRTATIATLAGLISFASAHAQPLGLGQQTLPGYYAGSSPTFPGYQPAPVIGGVSQAPDPPPSYQPPPMYQPQTPQYLPSYNGGMAGSSFRPRQ
jgi:hypothetical protein